MVFVLSPHGLEQFSWPFASGWLRLHLASLSTTTAHSHTRIRTKAPQFLTAKYFNTRAALFFCCQCWSHPEVLSGHRRTGSVGHVPGPGQIPAVYQEYIEKLTQLSPCRTTLWPPLQQFTSLIEWISKVYSWLWKAPEKRKGILTRQYKNCIKCFHWFFFLHFLDHKIGESLFLCATVFVKISMFIRYSLDICISSNLTKLLPRSHFSCHKDILRRFTAADWVSHCSLFMGLAGHRQQLDHIR